MDMANGHSGEGGYGRWGIYSPPTLLVDLSNGKRRAWNFELPFSSNLIQMVAEREYPGEDIKVLSYEWIEPQQKELRGEWGGSWRSFEAKTEWEAYTASLEVL
jgi:hypothetical protein